MWTSEKRATYDHQTKRYPSDLTDDEWRLIEPHLLPPTKDVAIRRSTGAR